MREATTMKGFDRRTFLKLAGGSTVAAAAAVVSGAALRLPEAPRYLTFRASAGLPAKPLPSMVTKIVEGHVDLESGSGTITSRVLAGHPVPSQIALPGLTRLIRVTSATQEGGSVRLTGVVDDRSQLLRGESPNLEFVIDRKLGTVTAPLAGHNVTLTIE
ncbi:MAG: hypothetical protein AUG06_08165 [Actinobacteria bacterium 13_1_20CM_2_65_11]|nr:MAG: hypothetical protein AUH40_02845 [Chloroflexi bacterium 13_1_40CM_65_17]OLC65212.1 MAG: hypothetical protein AUH69_10025 [Actinobacteria bacterium 13_1_40CM_4_65_12]OLD50088.1 MAG: hypothetical protein AUI42_04930 [Actinobacteria bacterium 13_1_40CM_2_65_8]OLE79299.1 MAG: hypothetical protein AUG06_08165 [Actinobacteria bacterium 13_1_20CM_2_65_11]